MIRQRRLFADVWWRNACVLITTMIFATTTAATVIHANDMDDDFDDVVAPILARRCLECHNSFDEQGGLDLSSRMTATKGGDSGAVIVPGKPEASLLWQRIADDEMPPDEPLPAEERAVLKRWLIDGSRWGTDPIDVFRYSSEKRAGYNWWSLQPVTRPAPPETESAWARSPIDAFVLERLANTGLTPSPEGDRRTLVRRLSFDLTGLPPTPADVDDFVSDDRDDAYERLVDRLLASPAYGDRWARHWLDIVRFGESQGFERDKLRDNSWRYRNWVVDALNQDLPYDEFARLQLAGDVIDDAGNDGRIATGFLVAGPWDEVGQRQQSAAMKRVVRQDELEDYISTIGQTFLGLTVNCARCHDHKFDPVRQSEYYRLAAALNGVKHGEPAVDGLSIETTPLTSALAAIESKLEQLERPHREQILAERSQEVNDVQPPEPLARWTFDDSTDGEDSLLPLEVHGAARIRDGRLRVDGKTGYVTSAPLPTDVSAKTVEVWVKLDTLAQRGGGAISLQTLDGAVFDAIVFGEREPLKWMAGSNGFSRYDSFGGPEEADADHEFVHVAISWAKDGTITAYRNGHLYGEPYQAAPPPTFRQGEAQLLFGLRHTPPGGNRFLSAMLEQASLYDRALSAEEVAASAGVASDFVAPEQLRAAMSPEDRVLHDRWTFEADHLRRQIARAELPTIYAVDPVEQPEQMQVMLRGNPATPGEQVSPGGVAAVLAEAADFAIPENATDAERRRALADWITDRENPLFPRVIVNQLWQYHFGVGFVPTPSDLGFNGGQPTHPELLDWLATELMDNGYSLKHLHRLMVTSATYRQSSKPRKEAMAVDAGNRWLWRMSPRRLEAESVRDAILAITGELNPQLGGPGYHDFTTFTRNTQFYELVDPIGASFNRRSLYRCWVRSGRSPFLDVFDCPDPSTKTPRRAVTTTPLQSLALMNNAFVLRMSENFADRLEAEHPGDVGGQLTAAIERAYGRSPTESERRQMQAFVDVHGLAAFCRVLFNTNEFLYVE